MTGETKQSETMTTSDPEADAIMDEVLKVWPTWSMGKKARFLEGVRLIKEGEHDLEKVMAQTEDIEKEIDKLEGRQEP